MDCPDCGNNARKNGLTKAGEQRYYCAKCGWSNLWKPKQTKEEKYKKQNEYQKANRAKCSKYQRNYRLRKKIEKKKMIREQIAKKKLAKENPDASC